MSAEQPPLIAIGLDAADFRQIEKWMDAGFLPVLAGLRKRGAYGRLTGPEAFSVETTWTNFHTGVFPKKHGYWSTVQYDPATYGAVENFTTCYDFSEYPPFFSLGNKKAAVFDAPHFRLTPGVKGVQAVAWGSHSPLSRSGSIPGGFLAEIESKFGKHPTLMADHMDWWVKDRYETYKEKLFTGIERRAEICAHLLKREPWDLFLTVFGESHAIGHDFYFMTRTDHPLAAYRSQIGYGEDPCLAVARKIDEAMGKILSASPANARIVVFSPHGMRANQKDLMSQLFLPEFLHRAHFGKGSFADRPLKDKTSPPVLRCAKKSWVAEIWRIKKETSLFRQLLKKVVPIRYLQRFDRALKTASGKTFYVPEHLYGYIGTHPGLWYKQYWPKMRFFPMPSYGDGYIRINLKGREAGGIVEAKDYEKVCGEAETFLSGIRSARTGEPMVKKVIRTRKDPADRDPKLPTADLVVLWSAEAADAVVHPETGTIGPVPFSRSGAHVALGFYVAAGPGIEPGSRPAEDSIHLTSTLLHLMGCPIPGNLDAKKVLF